VTASGDPTRAARSNFIDLVNFIRVDPNIKMYYIGNKSLIWMGTVFIIFTRLCSMRTQTIIPAIFLFLRKIAGIIVHKKSQASIKQYLLFIYDWKKDIYIYVYILQTVNKQLDKNVSIL
jgi:hypothetical protein